MPILEVTLAKWHQMLATQNFEQLDELLAEDVIFRSPVAYQPYQGKAVVSFILNQVIQVFEDFTYQRQMYSHDGYNVVLEFSAKVDDKQLKGIDMIRINQAGQIIDFEVMLRPKSGLEALARHMGQRIEKFVPK